MEKKVVIISREDLLIKLKAAHAEVTLLRKQVSELTVKVAANEQYIKEQEEIVKKFNRSEVPLLMDELRKAKEKIRNQRETLSRLQAKKSSFIKVIK